MWTQDTLLTIQGRLVRLRDLIGKTLFATGPTNIYRNWNANSVFVAKPPQALGNLYSWITDTAGNNYLMFKDQNQRPYYVKYREGLLSLTALTSQDVVPLPTPGEVERDRNKPKDTGEAVSNFLHLSLWMAAGLFAYKIYSDSSKRR